MHHFSVDTNNINSPPPGRSMCTRLLAPSGPQISHVPPHLHPAPPRDRHPAPHESDVQAFAQTGRIRTLRRRRRVGRYDYLGLDGNPKFKGRQIYQNLMLRVIQQQDQWSQSLGDFCESSATKDGEQRFHTTKQTAPFRFFL